MEYASTSTALAPSGAPPQASGFLASIARTIGSTLRALFFLRVEPRPAPPHGAAVVFIALLAILSEIAVGWFANRHLSLPRTSGLTSSIASFGVLAGGLLLLSGRRRAFDVAAAFCILVCLAIPLSPAALLVLELPQRVPATIASPEIVLNISMAAFIVMAVWWFAASARLGACLMPARRWRGAFGLIAVSLLTAFLLPRWPLVPSKLDDEDAVSLVELARDFVRPPPPSTEPRPRIDVEAAYARQPRLVAAEIERLRPSRRDRGELYFVSAGTYAGQDVFLREASTAREVFDARMGTSGRSLLLVNNRQTVDTLPLANATNLELMLSGLAKVMDVEKDVLVLFLTSHGTEQALSVSFGGFSFNDLTPERLAGVLARSGIRNRVVIVSACHSGTFIPALQSPGTMVITAARTDRTSFGCSNEREWTYFGDAYFNRALRETRSLTEAYEIARTHISDWEKRDRLTPSEPQIFIGEEIAAKLREITARLDAETAQATPPTTRLEQYGFSFKRSSLE